MTIKDQLLEYVRTGQLTNPFTVRDFRRMFPDIKSHTTFCPLAAIEPGRVWPNNQRYLIKMGRGIYKVHQDALTEKAP